MNVILVVIDSLRKDHVGCYGNGWIQTPNMDAFAKESCLFEQCYPESLPTLPARRAMITGNRMFPFRNWREESPGDLQSDATPGWAPLRKTDVTISEILQEAGYRTAFITDIHHMFRPSMNFHRGFDEFRHIRGNEGDRYNSGPPPKDIDIDHFLVPALYDTYAHQGLLRYLSNTSFRKGEEDYFAPLVFGEGIRWLEANRDAEKFFLWIDCFDPHEPWDPPQKYVDLYDPGYEGKEIINPQTGDPNTYLSEKELKHMRALYAGEVTMVDTWFGKFIDKTKALNLHENTLIIIVADHGHPLGEHKVVRKIPWAMYPTLMDIPLLIRHPNGIGAGKRIQAYVQHHDLFTTALNFTGVTAPKPVDGEDLIPLMSGQSGPQRDHVTCGCRRYVWLRDERYVYIAVADGTYPQLFDLRSDPGQFNNMAPDHPDICSKMHEKVLEDAGGPLPDFSGLTDFAAGVFVPPPGS